MSTREHPRMVYQIEKTRKKILKKSLEMFLRKGLFTTQMKDIAKEVGISRTSLYRYFRDKTDLAILLVSNLLGRLETEWLNSEAHKKIKNYSGINYLKDFFRKFFLSPKYLSEWTYMAEFDAYYSGVRTTQEIESSFKTRIPNAGMKLVVEYIFRGQKDGSIRQNIDPHLCAVTLINSVRALQQRMILRGSLLVELENNENSLIMDELLDYLFRGIKQEIVD